MSRSEPESGVFLDQKRLDLSGAKGEVKGFKVMSSVLVMGSGAREHALAWKLSQSPKVSHIIVAPGNPGMPAHWERWPLDLNAALGPQAEVIFSKLAHRAKQADVSLVVVGPDQPLSEGAVDQLKRAGLVVFGPQAQAARIESSKSFAKQLMKQASIPTARYWVAADIEEARKILKSLPWGPSLRPKRSSSHSLGWVIKADGLALGKGVRVCDRLDEALEACQELGALCFPHNPRLVIEEKVSGQELSWMAFCDGSTCALLEPAQDYKRLLDGDLGPNTGGMGALSPVPGVPRSWFNRIREEVFLPALREMKNLGHPFAGLLYAGLMVDWEADRYWVLEFNARFGDPETQVLLPRFKGDLLPWLMASAQGDLSGLPAEVPFEPDAAVYVVAGSQGYPQAPRLGQRIEIGAQSPHPEVEMKGSAELPSYFFAGVKEDAERHLCSSGGRVMGALGLAPSLAAARQKAYENLSQVRFDGMIWRSDIGCGL
ncbi:MAG: phosphoribosylamine--glycine ligase [Bdellovibrionia bacterium]